MNSHPPDDPAAARDAHLLAALRHAPDHDVAPPAQLTAAILDQAQHALRPRWRERWRAAFARLAQPVPMAAFGTLAMATLIGVLWSGRELPEAAPAAMAESVAASAAPAAATVTAPNSAAREVARDAEARAPAPRPAPKPTAKPAAPAAAVEARQDAAPERLSLRDAPAAPREALAKSSADDSAAARARSEAAAAPALGAIAPTAATPLAAPSAEIDAATGAGPARNVQWRLTPQRSVGHGAAQRDWWSALLSTTRGRWQRVQAGTASGEPESLTLVIDGAPRGHLSFETEAVVWRDGGSGAAWRAPLATETLRAWREAFERW